MSRPVLQAGQGARQQLAMPGERSCEGGPLPEGWTQALVLPVLQGRKQSGRPDALLRCSFPPGRKRLHRAPMLPPGHGPSAGLAEVGMVPAAEASMIPRIGGPVTVGSGRGACARKK